MTAPSSCFVGILLTKDKSHVLHNLIIYNIYIVLINIQRQLNSFNKNYFTVPSSSPVAITLTEMPSGALEKQTAVIFLSLSMLPMYEAFIVSNVRIDLPLLSLCATVTISPRVSLIDTKFICK